MPKVRDERRQPPQRSVAAAPKRIGTLVSTDTFHCVKACDYHVFYKVLTQLK